MIATVARREGQVQLEQSDLRLALNMAKGGVSRAATEEMQQLIKNPRAEVWEQKKQGVVYPGHKMVKAAIRRHPAKVYKSHTDVCLPS